MKPNMSEIPFDDGSGAPEGTGVNDDGEPC